MGQWWLDALILAGGIFFIIVMMILRAVLSYPFPKYRVRLLPANYQPPESVADLYFFAQQAFFISGFDAPRWMVLEPDPPQPGELKIAACVFAHHEHATRVLVFPPLSIEAPNMLLVKYITWLADGRVLISQVRDAFAEAAADGQRVLAQTIDGETVAEQWAQHLEWREQFDVAGLPDDAVDKQLLDELEDKHGDRKRLVAEGKLWCDAKGVTRFRLRFALRALRLYFSRPRPKADKRDIPVARLEMLSTILKNQQKRLLPLRWQWLMFAASCVLFAVLGGVFFGASFALALLGVIILHEGGHFWAMRLFGYRNVQMIALPLLGGVTIGVEKHPSAVHRAWVALLGPLPGIILGWVILGIAMSAGAPTLGLKGELIMAGVVLLLVNYLNLMPVPPLDGSAIMQAMLPPRWFIIRNLLVLVGCALGIALAWMYNLYILVFIVILQLITILPGLRKQRRIINLLSDDPAFIAADRTQKRKMALQVLHDSFGSKGKAQQLIKQANDITDMFTQTPMGHGQRLLLGGLYAGLLCVPFFFIWPMFFSMSLSSEFKEKLEAHQQRLEQQEALAKTLPLPQLLAGISEENIPPPATETALDEAATRLGQALPEELKTLYRTANGVPALNVIAVQQIHWAARHPRWSAFVKNADGEITLWLPGEDDDGRVLANNAPGWLYLGGEDTYQAFLYRPDETSELGGYWLECNYSICASYGSFRQWIEEQWASHTVSFDE